MKQKVIGSFFNDPLETENIVHQNRMYYKEKWDKETKPAFNNTGYISRIFTNNHNSNIIRNKQ